jgi:glycosyltransferase involved in cell wall biosynthesis
MPLSKLSVIVPVYNEAECIRDCLSRLGNQMDSIHEVIVVDNNSTDGTHAIVDEFVSANPKFSVATEENQGLIFARNTGLDRATGDVLARIDADTRVGPTWATAVVDFFERHGEIYSGATGLCTLYDAPFQERFVRSHQELTIRMQTSSEPMEQSRLFGSNMAISAPVWRQIRDATSRRPDVFEDLDIALCLEESGAKMALIPGADATISGRRFLTGPIAQIRYELCDQRTYRVHGMRRRQRTAILSMLVGRLPFYAAMYIPFRMYDPEAGNFSVSNLFRRRSANVRAHA